MNRSIQRPPLLLALSLLVVSAFAQNETDTPRKEFPSARHTISLYAPDLTLLNTVDYFGVGWARVTSASVQYQYFFDEDTWYAGGFLGPAMTHPRLVAIAGEWSGYEAGITYGGGGSVGGPFWLGMQLRASIVRSPFRIDGYVLDDGGQFFAPELDVRSVLRQNNFELTAISRVALGKSGLYLAIEGGASIYGRGIFSDADLYPNFTSRGFLFADTVRLPQNEYNSSIALRARVGLGFVL